MTRYFLAAGVSAVALSLGAVITASSAVADDSAYISQVNETQSYAVQNQVGNNGNTSYIYQNGGTSDAASQTANGANATQSIYQGYYYGPNTSASASQSDNATGSTQTSVQDYTGVSKTTNNGSSVTQTINLTGGTGNSQAAYEYGSLGGSITQTQGDGSAALYNNSQIAYLGTVGSSRAADNGATQTIVGGSNNAQSANIADVSFNNNISQFTNGANNIQSANISGASSGSLLLQNIGQNAYVSGYNATTAGSSDKETATISGGSSGVVVDQSLRTGSSSDQQTISVSGSQGVYAWQRSDNYQTNSQANLTITGSSALKASQYSNGGNADTQTITVSSSIGQATSDNSPSDIYQYQNGGVASSSQTASETGTNGRTDRAVSGHQRHQQQPDRHPDRHNRQCDRSVPGRFL